MVYAATNIVILCSTFQCLSSISFLGRLLRSSGYTAGHLLLHSAYRYRKGFTVFDQQDRRRNNAWKRGTPIQYLICFHKVSQAAVGLGVIVVYTVFRCVVVLRTRTVEVTRMTVVVGAGITCRCNVCTAVTVRVDRGRALDCAACVGGTMIVCTPFRDEELDEAMEGIGDDDILEDVGSATQIPLPSDELVIRLGVPVLLEVLKTALDVDDAVDIEGDCSEGSDRSEHQGRTEDSGEVAVSAAISCRCVAILWLESPVSGLICLLRLLHAS